MKYVAFYSYKSGVGKDLAADYFQEIVEAQGYSVYRTAFAREMKLVAADALDIHGNDDERVAEIDALKVGGTVTVRYPQESGIDYLHQVTGRDFIIGLAGDSSGTNGIRRLDQEFWVKHALRIHACDFFLLTDLRFRPEADAIWDRNGVLINIISSSRGKHHNEDFIDMRSSDFSILNDASPDFLRRKIIQITQALTAGLRM